MGFAFNIEFSLLVFTFPISASYIDPGTVLGASGINVV